MKAEFPNFYNPKQIRDKKRLIKKIKKAFDKLQSELKPPVKEGTIIKLKKECE